MQDNNTHKKEPQQVGAIIEEMKKDPTSIVFKLDQWRVKHGK
jgi:hypothetical protein